MPVEFNNESVQQRAAFLAQVNTTQDSRGMEKFLIDKGIAGSPKQAKIYLILAIIICCVASGIIIYKSSTGSASRQGIEIKNLPDSDPSSPNFRPQ